MLADNEIVKVTNRDNGSVGYTIPDLGNLHRNFYPSETKKIPVEELRKLSYIAGGDYILKNCLSIDNKELVEELLGKVEPEYFYTKEEVETLLKTGSLDEFLDCLDFAPDGVIDLIKDIAVDIELNDVAKREAILKKTGFDVSKAIMINKETNEEVKKEEKGKRRVSLSAKNMEDGTPQRRVVLSDKK